MPEQVLATSAPDPWISEILTLLFLKKDASITFFVTNGFFWLILSHIAPFQDKVELRLNWQSLAYAVIARKAGKVGDGIGLGEAGLITQEIPLIQGGCSEDIG